MLFSKWYRCFGCDLFFNHQSTLPLLMLDGLMSHLDANLTNLYAPAPASFLWLLVCFFAADLLLFHLVFALGFTCFQSCLTAPAGIVPVVNMEHKRIMSIPHEGLSPRSAAVNRPGPFETRTAHSGEPTYASTKATWQSLSLLGSTTWNVMFLPVFWMALRIYTI